MNMRSCKERLKRLYCLNTHRVCFERGTCVLLLTVKEFSSYSISKCLEPAKVGEGKRSLFCWWGKVDLEVLCRAISVWHKK